jgi:hypothetical protein
VLATYTTTTGPGAETVRLDANDEGYVVNWHTNEFNLSTINTYRMSVRAGANVLLGYADVQPKWRRRLAERRYRSGNRSGGWPDPGDQVPRGDRDRRPGERRAGGSRDGAGLDPAMHDDPVRKALWAGWCSEAPSVPLRVHRVYASKTSDGIHEQ